MKPGKYDRRHRILISGVELQALKSLAMPESFGFHQRICGPLATEGRWKSSARPQKRFSRVESLAKGAPVDPGGSHGTTSARDGVQTYAKRAASKAERSQLKAPVLEISSILGYI